MPHFPSGLLARNNFRFARHKGAIRPCDRRAVMYQDLDLSLPTVRPTIFCAFVRQPSTVAGAGSACPPFLPWFPCNDPMSGLLLAHMAKLGGGCFAVPALLASLPTEKRTHEATV
jgi:hypothetical protein